MPEYLRVADFEGDEAALEGFVKMINDHPGPPEGVPVSRITILADRSGGKVRVGMRFGSEEDLRTGSATLDAMSPPADVNMRRVSVEEFEIVLERQV